MDEGFRAGFFLTGIEHATIVRGRGEDEDEDLGSHICLVLEEPQPQGGKQTKKTKTNGAIPASGEVPHEAYWPREALPRGPRGFKQSTLKEETRVLDCFTGALGEAIQKRTLGCSCGRSRAS